jgi:hypothetical protein
VVFRLKDKPMMPADQPPHVTHHVELVEDAEIELLLGRKPLLQQSENADELLLATMHQFCRTIELAFRFVVHCEPA